jgi:hypothetical protein
MDIALALYAEIKQKNQKWIIHEKLTVATSEREGKLSNPRARRALTLHGENIRKSLWKPACVCCARSMHLFYCNQKYSTILK